MPEDSQPSTPLDTLAARQAHADEILDEMRDLLPAKKIAGRIEELMNAKRVMKNGKEAPDTRANEVGLKLALQYCLGTPIQRSEAIVRNIDESEAAFMSRLESSPHLRRAMRRAIDDAEAKAGAIEAKDE